ncbi:vegetative cell wall protein gp1-like [Oryx dammah]|uniref:vegetative cell wall protein gp1-like n=1 Tax=Oryx dammah TaxID=59534 RepID=UPI001A9B6B85|nr:vegetative cell wall protein gp1-like [Oryx dammah]
MAAKRSRDHGDGWAAGQTPAASAHSPPPPLPGIQGSAPKMRCFRGCDPRLRDGMEEGTCAWSSRALYMLAHSLAAAVPYEGLFQMSEEEACHPSPQGLLPLLNVPSVYEVSQRVAPPPRGVSPLPLSASSSFFRLVGAGSSLMNGGPRPPAPAPRPGFDPSSPPPRTSPRPAPVSAPPRAPTRPRLAPAPPLPCAPAPPRPSLSPALRPRPGSEPAPPRPSARLRPASPSRSASRWRSPAAPAEPGAPHDRSPPLQTRVAAAGARGAA